MASDSGRHGERPAATNPPPSSSRSLVPSAPSSSRSLAPPALQGFHDAEAARRAAALSDPPPPPSSRSIPPNPVLLALEAQRRTSQAPPRRSSSLAPRVFERPPPGLNTKVINVSEGVSWRAVALTAGAVVVLCAIAAYVIFR